MESPKRDVSWARFSLELIGDNWLLLGYKHGHTEDYVNIVSELMYPKCDFGPYGYDHDHRRVGLTLPLFMTVWCWLRSFRSVSYRAYEFVGMAIVSFTQGFSVW